MGVLNENKAGAAHRVGENPTTPTLIYCASGNKRYMDIAISQGFKCGAQLPGTIYHDLYFADQNYHNPNFEAYMSALEKHKPYMATVIDYEDHIPFSEVMRWAETACRFVQDTVIIIPKVCGTIPDIPREINGKRVRLGYSIPTTHGGTQVPVWEFKGRDVHLLGGSPQKQIENMRYLGSDVKSADGNYIAKLASARAQFFVNGTAIHTKDRWFPQLQEMGLGHFDSDINYAAFELSCLNFRLAVQTDVTAAIRWSTENDIPAIKKIANQFKSELGYVMYPSLRRAIEHRELFVATYGQEIVGFVNWHKRRDGWHTIYEIAVAKHRQGERIGAALLHAVPRPMRLKCTVDNGKANDFYTSQGLQLIDTETGRKRELNVWISPS